MEQLLKLATTSLSYAIVAGSFTLKAPQIVKILKHSSAEGISLPSVLLESLGYATGTTTWGLAQGLDFKDYGEGVIISVQLVVLVALVAYFQRKLAKALALFAPLVATFGILSLGYVPEPMHRLVMSGSTIATLASRLPQIYTNYKRKSTGQLAFLTFFLAFGGSAVRVLTVFMNVPQDKGRDTLILQFVLSTVLNLLIIIQMYLYRHAGAGKKNESPARAGTKKRD